MPITALRIAAAAVGLLAAVVGVVMVLGGDPYTINARFDHAGQLIKGGDVQVAGRRVGSITDISLTDEGEANVELTIDDEVAPLRTGTRATIRALSQAGVASRFVDLAPATGSAPPIRPGAVLPTSQTRTIVDLDELLNTFGPEQRKDVQALIDESAHVFAGSGSASFNSMLGKLDPALREVQGMMRELAYDRRSLGRFVRSAGAASEAVARQPARLEGAVVNTARTFEAIAAERDALAAGLRRAPSVLRQATGTLRRASVAVDAVRPTLREVPPVAGPARRLLRRATPALGQSEPVVARLVKQLPPLRQSLAGFKKLGRPGVDALRSIAPAVNGADPILKGLRYYSPDFLLGVTNGLAGLLAANYNDGGHYARLSFLQSTQSTISGIPSALLTQFPLVPGLLNWRTRLTAPCPGSSQPPAPDGSNQWVPDPTLCEPSHAIPASVNAP